MIYTGLGRVGEIADVKANGGADVAEVYGGIGESNPIFYSRKTITGTSPLTFKALGQPLKDYTISGNTVQNGTPTPSDPVDVVGCWVWDEAHQSYKLPLTVNGIEYQIYLGQVPTTRRIKKLVLTGEENFITKDSPDITNYMYMLRLDHERTFGICSHLPYTDSYPRTFIGFRTDASAYYIYMNIGAELQETQPSGNTVAGFKEYLAAQYAAGTPVTIWYVLADPETGIVNEPLMKIGDYADTISMTQAGVTIPTVAGANALTVDTTVQPSAVSITDNIKPTGYGQLLDVNDVDIQDSNSTPIFIQG